ncbi:YihY/virulence factor BrkB family protein [Litchfieldella xinjiangensis]|uniref:YihY/virulence factor BrkB family protein n=1 Tax=Litchfieldella xinjiangensis TaxID=1166948 RepID=UPI0005B801F8|nr:YihY/virulence factor BrkB family protein [Halomonas xinjiangensis]
MTDTSQAEHGRQADRPGQIPKRGWWDILKRVKGEMDRDHIPIIAAGVAFYALLAIFPAIVAITSVWALVFDPQEISQQIENVSHLLPGQAADLITQQAEQATEDASVGMSLAAIGGILLAIYSSSKGTKGLMEGLNIAYDELDERGMIKKTLLTLVLTAGGIVMTVVALGTVTAIPVLVDLLGLDGVIGTAINIARWPLLLAVVMVGLAVLYRYAPDRQEPRWQWTSPGSTVAVVLWVIGSIGFSLYVRNFASYNETYGSLGAVIILLMWFWLSAFIVLMGAELNSEMEKQTKHDTTHGQRNRMGKRDAYAADSLGRSQ